MFYDEFTRHKIQMRCTRSRTYFICNQERLLSDENNHALKRVKVIADNLRSLELGVVDSS